MIPRARSASPNFLGPEFNRFLFAMVGTDRNGGQLTVVSALARLDLDAWAEAAALARLPREAAVSKLSGILRRYPEIPQVAQEAGVIATRLVALLPRSATPKLPAKPVPVRWVASAAAGFSLLIAIGLMLSLQYTRTPAPRQAAGTAPAVVTAAMHKPPAPGN